MATALRGGFIAATLWFVGLLFAARLWTGSGPHSFHVLVALLLTPVAFGAGALGAGIFRQEE